LAFGGGGHALASCEVSVALLFGSTGKLGLGGSREEDTYFHFPPLLLSLLVSRPMYVAMPRLVKSSVSSTLSSQVLRPWAISLTSPCQAMLSHGYRP